MSNNATATGKKTPRIKKSWMLFVRSYIANDFKDAGAAYRLAYPESGEESARVNASRLLSKDNIQELLSSELEKVISKSKVPLEKRVLDTWIVRAFYDPTEIIGLDGLLKIDEAELRKRGLHVCIDSISKKINTTGYAYLEYKLADRDKALDMLNQYIKMIEAPKQKLELSASITIGEPPKPADLPTEEGASA